MSSFQQSSHATTFVFITVLLDMVGFGLIMPVLPQLISQVGQTDLAHSSIIGGWMFFAFSATQFLFGPALGNLSDAFGRRPMLLLAVAGLGVDYVLHAFAPNLAWLFVGRAIAGLCGASYVIANAYIADVTKPEDRAKAFGMIGAAFGIGFVIGPAIGGVLGAYGARVPFFAAAAVSALNLVYGYFVLPETLAPANRRPFELARSNPLGTLRIFRQYKSVLPLCGIFFVYFAASSVYPAIWSYWGIAKFNWSPAIIGGTLAAFGIVTAITQATLTGPAVKRWGEVRLALAGLALGAIVAAAYGFANSLWTVLILLLFHAPEGFVHPMLTAIMSKEVPEDAQGELQGGLGSVMAVAMLVGTVFYSQIFGFFLRPSAPVVSPDIAFFVAGVVLATVFAMFWKFARDHQVTVFTKEHQSPAPTSQP